MENETKPGMGFLPTAPSLKKRIVPDVTPNPAPPAPVVNNYNIFVDPQAATALQNALMYAAIYALAVIVLFVLIRSFSRA
jgi:hypothetical protein